MKKFLPLLLILCLLMAASQAEAPRLQPTAEPTAETLAPALTLTMTEVNLRRGYTQRILARREDGSRPADLTWISTKPEVASVDRGLIKGLAEGEADIVCTDASQPFLSAVCHVRVTVAMMGMDAATRRLELLPGETAQAELSYRPADATRPQLLWSSDRPECATVDENGLVTALAPGRARITARTAEEPYRTVSIPVSVPAIRFDSSQVELTEPQGTSITLHYFGKDRSKLLFRMNGGAVLYRPHWVDEQTCTLTLVPEAAGSGSLSVRDTAARGVFTSLGLHVQRNAVLGLADVPNIQYEQALQDPEGFRDKAVKVQGTVLQVVKESNPLTLRVGLGQRKQRVVYVTAADGALDSINAKGRRVLVRGRYAGNFSYETLWGTPMTLPLVEAETVGLK